MESDYPQFSPGQKVVDRYGVRLTVLFQRGCQVFTSGGGWYHPTKIWAA